MLGIVFISYLFYCRPTAGQNSAERIFDSLLPLFATWIGTVLAFYYGREHFEAASNIRKFSKETLDDLNVLNVMILTKTMVTWSFDDNQNKLEDILDVFTKIKKDRIPILDKANKPLYMIHRHRMEKFYLKQKSSFESSSVPSELQNAVDSEPDTQNTQDSPPDSSTNSQSLDLQSFIDNNEQRFGHNEINGFVTVSKDISIQKALRLMNSVKCKDIFVTENGTKNSPVIGWVTDVLVTRFLTV